MAPDRLLPDTPKPVAASQRPGALWLRGNAAGLDDGSPVVFVGCRQQHFVCDVAASLDFAPIRDGEEAGLTVWMNPRHHYDLFVTHLDGRRCIVARQRIGDLVAIVARESIGDGSLMLTIRADSQHYTFGYSINNAAPQLLASGATRYLSTEVAGGFTGVYLAMYATGNGQASKSPALFDWFDYHGAP